MCLVSLRDLRFSLYAILVALHLHSHLWLVAAAWGSARRVILDHDWVPRETAGQGCPLVRTLKGAGYAPHLRSNFFP